MSKLNIPTCKFNDEECNTLLLSITEKLNIQNPQFFYPIYKKVIDDESMTPAELRGIIFDSKFKCKEILSKVLDCDSDGFETDPDDTNETSTDPAILADTTDQANIIDKPHFIFKDINAENIDICTSQDICTAQDFASDIQNIEHILNTSDDIDIENNKYKKNANANANANADADADGNVEAEAEAKAEEETEEDEEAEDEEDEDEDNDDMEIEEAINNTFTANGIIERLNKQTGEKIFKEEKIHIKKTALLEPLKIMKDEFVIPARIEHKNLDDETFKNTMNKLNSYNNSGHVEALFLYLGNKLVESGKCPSFPYYYGCINGEDPNYHHNITDEYESVSRTKWFRNRVKNDFDLLIIENDEIDDMQTQMENNLRKPFSISRNINVNVNGEQTSDDDDADAASSDDADDVNTSNQDTSNQDKQIDNEQNMEPKTIIPIDAIDSVLDNILDDMKNKDASNINLNSIDFIKELNDDDLYIDEQTGGNFADDVDTKADDVDTKADDVDIKADDADDADADDADDKDVDEDDKDVDSDEESYFIEELSDVDADNLSFSEFENNGSNLYYIKCDKMPVNLCLMEKLDQTLDNLLDAGYNMSEIEWFSVFFQVSFGLAIAQKYFNFVHNDLHSSNVMFKESKLKHIYFQIGNVYYKIPTYGKITKIIDFARGTFKLGDRWIFSDQFKEDGDAWGQYDYPIDGTLQNCEHKPNPSFDLVRLGTTVIQRLEDKQSVREFVESITKDDYENSLCYEKDDFQLYIDIAHNAHAAIPIEVMQRNEFERFIIAKSKIPKNTYIFKY
jgi:hypothetical protein